MPEEITLTKKMEYFNDYDDRYTIYHSSEGKVIEFKEDAQFAENIGRYYKGCSIVSIKNINSKQ